MIDEIVLGLIFFVNLKIVGYGAWISTLQLTGHWDDARRHIMTKSKGIRHVNP